jgi:arylsulfatase A-like enzyme
MMTRSAGSITSGIKLGMLAGLWVLATELVYSRVLLPYPVRVEGQLLLFYGLVFAAIGLMAGIASLPLPQLGSGLPAAIVGGILTVLMLGLRLHDLSDTGIGQPMDAGLVLFALSVAAGVAWLASRIPADSVRRAAPTLLLAASVPAAVFATKLLVDTADIQVRHPVPVAFAIVGLVPLLLTQLYRITVARWIEPRRLVAAAWLAPLVVIAACALDLYPGSAGQTVASAEGASTPHLPPIIWITIDTLRADHMSVYGYPVHNTPNLEEFARGATVYTQCQAQSNTTAQSVPSLLGGITPYRHGGVSETRRLREDVKLLPEMLQDRGYQTVAQSANHWVSSRYGMAQGFEDFRLYNTDNELFLYDFMKLAMRLAPWEVFRLREHLPSYAYVPIATLLDDTNEILRTRDRARPLFLYLQPVDPHGPYQPPLRYVQTEGAAFGPDDYVSYWALKAGVTVSPRQHDAIVALYDGAIAYTDAQLGRMFDVLREFDLFDKSLIVITADHGEQFQDHGLWRHSNSLYQQLLHVPLLVKYPGQTTPKVVEDRVAAIDIVPTVLRLFGERCETCEGRPLQEAGTDQGSRPFFSYFMDHDEVRPVMRSVVADGWKLVRMLKNGVENEELYYIDTDPGDSYDLRATYPQVAVRLAGLINDYEAAAGPAPAADTISLRPAELERLKALGYVQ